jgi:hypothetical protein
MLPDMYRVPPYIGNLHRAEKRQAEKVAPRYLMNQGMRGDGRDSVIALVMEGMTSSAKPSTKSFRYSRDSFQFYAIFDLC